MTNLEILQKSPMELESYLYSNFSFVLPDKIETAQDLADAQVMLSKLTNTYSYITHLATLAKNLVRITKRDYKNDKDKCNDAVDRKDTVAEFKETIKINISSLSRMITIKQEINKELNMSNSIDSMYGRAI